MRFLFLDGEGKETGPRPPIVLSPEPFGWHFLILLTSSSSLIEGGWVKGSHKGDRWKAENSPQVSKLELYPDFFFKSKYKQSGQRECLGRGGER
jgi:hypothetical protein